MVAFNRVILTHFVRLFNVSLLFTYSVLVGFSSWLIASACFAAPRLAVRRAAHANGSASA